MDYPRKNLPLGAANKGDYLGIEHREEHFTGDFQLLTQKQEGKNSGILGYSIYEKREPRR